MKKGSKFFLLVVILFIICSFITDINVNALTLSKKEELEYNGVSFYRKQIGGSNVYSISGLATPAPLSQEEEGGPTQCNAIAETENNIYYAYIIEHTNGASVGGSVTAANWYTIENELSSIKHYDNANTDVEVFNQSGNSKITANPSILKFNKNGTNYVSTFTLSGNNFSQILSCNVIGVAGTAKASSISNNSATVNVTIPVANVTNNLMATVTCSVKQTYKTTNVYSCGNGYQSLTSDPITKAKETNISVKGNLTAEVKGSIKIIKRGKNSQGKTKPLSGVKYKIKNSKGKTINDKGKEDSDYVFTTNSSGIISIEDIKLSDTSSENVYTIEEISTVTGYEKYTKKITVTLSENNPTFEETIISKSIRVTISKTDKKSKKELPGAKLSIVDKKGKILKKSVFDKDKHLITYSDDSDAEACTWATTETPYLFEGIPVGKYYLIEELAPEGYVKNTEKIEIEIKAEGAVNKKINMKNALKVPIPETLNARTALLLAVAMFDVSLFIGILLYVKKNKNKE